MNELKINGTQKFMGIDIPIIEGGFGENCRVTFDKTIADIHGVSPSEIRKSINRLIKRGRLKESVDYIQLVNSLPVETLNGMLLTIGIRKQDITKAKEIFIMSERGYSKLIKAMDDDTSWDVMDKFIDEYFSMRKIINSDEHKKANLLLMIYNGGQDGVLASKELTQLEVQAATAPLIAENKELKPKAEFHDAVHISVNSISVGKFSGVLQNNLIFKKFGRNKLFQWLRDNDYLCVCGDLKNKPTQKALSGGYMDYDEYVGDNGHGKTITTYKPLITGKGQIYFTEKLMKEFGEDRE